MRRIVFIICFYAFFFIISNCFAQEGKVKFGTINQDNSQLYKISNSILTEAFKRLGIAFELKTYPAKRLPIEVNYEIIDGDSHRVFNFNKDNKYPNLIRVEESIQSVEQSVFTKLPNLKVNGWKSLSSYSIIYLAGIKVIENGLEEANIPKENRRQVFNIDKAFVLLDKGRGDLVIVSPSTGRCTLKKLELLNSGIKLLEPPVFKIKLYPYMHKKHKVIAIKLSTILKNMKKDGTYNLLINSITE